MSRRLGPLPSRAKGAHSPGMTICWVDKVDGTVQRRWYRILTGLQLQVGAI